MYDLIVIGGGPAGAAAAITCAKTGARVLMLERGRFPRHKACGEFVSAESLHVLGELLCEEKRALPTQSSRISQARIFVDGRMLEAPVEPPAASIARLELDAALWQSAEQAGVEAKQQATVQSVAGTGPFLIESSAGRLEARAVINASGRWSNLSAPPSNGDAKAKWIGIKGHFSEKRRSSSVDLYFLEGGYCGVQPVDLSTDQDHSRVNACAMVRADVASSLPEVFALHSDLAGRARDWQPLSEPVTTFPLIFRTPCPERDGIFMAGDAAGFVDPFVGDGISLALRSGRMAAECLLPFFAEKASLESARKTYVRRYETLVPVFQMASKIRKAISLPKVVRVPAMAVLQNAPVLTRYLVRKTR